MNLKNAEMNLSNTSESYGIKQVSHKGMPGIFIRHPKSFPQVADVSIIKIMQLLNVIIFEVLTHKTSRNQKKIKKRENTFLGEFGVVKIYTKPSTLYKLR